MHATDGLRILFRDSLPVHHRLALSSVGWRCERSGHVRDAGSQQVFSLALQFRDYVIMYISQFLIKVANH